MLNTAGLVQIILLCCLRLGLLQGQEIESHNTLRLIDTTDTFQATIGDMAWLAGTWQGEGLGAEVEEVWTMPQAGGMMGMFQMISESGIVFYELCQIVEDEHSLILRLKHFDKNLKGWEEKDEVVEFPLVKLEGQKVWFDGLTYERRGDTLYAWVVIEVGQEGETKEGSFVFTRIDE